MAEQQVLNSPELTSVIFQWMKSITLKEKKVTIVPEHIPEIPRAWTDIFARLVTVNSAFFRASTDVLWEHMLSIEPLFANVLPANRDAGGDVVYPLRYSQSKISSEFWKRFQIYSSKIKVLYLAHNTSLKLKYGWPVSLLQLEDQPETLLPSLQGLFLATSEPLLFYIAHSCGRTLKWAEADFSCLGSSSVAQALGAAFTSIMPRETASLTELRLTHIVSPLDIDRICEIRTLTSLKIVISHKESDYLGLSKLSRLPSLKRLHAKQQGSKGDSGTTVGILPRIDVQDLATRNPEIMHLEHLTVTAQGNTQLSILTALLPRTLTSLKLLVKEDPTNQQMLNIPRIAAIYAKRNLALTSLILGVEENRYDEPSFVDPTALLGLRHDEDFINLKPFFDALSTLHLLETLEIRSLPVLVTDSVLALLDVSRQLPGLRRLALYPNGVTEEEDDALVKPHLSVLEDIAKHNPRLKFLELSCQMSLPFPKAPAAFSNHPLHRISIGVGSPIDFEVLEGQDHVKLARYLVRLFPEVDLIYDPDPETMGFWDFIDELLQFARECRTQA